MKKEASSHETELIEETGREKGEDRRRKSGNKARRIAPIG
ncbi:unnamed protein product [Wuchereria bancrofti]|uniref:Uncharacterized protein n=1 Tax=Wuchereria bancrofti TaxID=6293 RepID=A0A3P7F3Z8_WUCBA|nr:unnamed protein product [Wuchereria bancrofti]